ncbi:MAG TPA: NAD(P)-dependent oxidoreductase [Gaiella sp.]|jgi:nucleoside-diphosphate-sugar epimerase
MRVFVAGGTGAIGRRLVPQLLLRGHEVTATTKDGRGVAELDALGADAAVVHGLDRADVRAAVVRARPDVIVHEMTALAGKPDIRNFDRWFAVTNELRTEGTKNLLSAAEAADVPRFVAQSYTGWNNERTGGRVKSETDPLDPVPAESQSESMAAIRFLEQAVHEADPQGVILRYGSLYGPGSSEALVALVRERKWPVVGDGGGVWSWLHLDDMAAATVAAVERAAPGVYNVVDDEPAEVADWLPFLADAVGAKPPRHVPAWLGRLAVGRVGVQWMTESRGASNRKAKAELGWRLRYPSWRLGFVEGLEAAPLDATALASLIGPPRSSASRGERAPRADGHVEAA